MQNVSRAPLLPGSVYIHLSQSQPGSAHKEYIVSLYLPFATHSRETVTTKRTDPELTTAAIVEGITLQGLFRLSS